MRRVLTVLLALACGPLALAADDPAQEARFLTNPRQLIFEGRRSGEGYFLSDGNKLIFQSEREPENPFYQIYTLDFQTGDTRRVSPGTGKTTCGFFRPRTAKLVPQGPNDEPASVLLDRLRLKNNGSDGKKVRSSRRGSRRKSSGS